MNREPTSAYDSNYDQEPAAKLSAAEIAERFNRDRFVKDAPRFAEQLEGGGRDNIITYIRSFDSLLDRTSDDRFRQSRAEISELGGLQELQAFLEIVKEYASKPQFAEVAQLMLDNLTFIGQQELREAANGIAAHWKARLDDNPRLQLLAVSGEVAKIQPYYRGSAPLVKSDSYILENILSNFTDEELARYAGRLLVDVEDITADPSNVAAIQIDDWIRSGEHMITSFEAFTDQNPHLEDSMEIQLIAVIEEVTRSGLPVLRSSDLSRVHLPIRAYYRAHDSRHQVVFHNSHITGSHSSADFDFAETLSKMAVHLRSTGIDLELPALANIVRPYRDYDSAEAGLVQYDRVKRFTRAAKEGDIDG